MHDVHDKTAQEKATNIPDVTASSDPGPSKYDTDGGAYEVPFHAGDACPAMFTIHTSPAPVPGAVMHDITDPNAESDSTMQPTATYS